MGCTQSTAIVRTSTCSAGFVQGCNVRAKDFDSTVRSTHPNRHTASSAPFSSHLPDQQRNSILNQEHYIGDSSTTINTSSSTSYAVRFASVSKRGYYPRSPHKANQDSCVVIPKFCGDENCLFAGVFDGHGKKGDLCSQFVARKLPQEISKAMGKRFASGSSLNLEEPTQVFSSITGAHIKVNDRLSQSSIDDTQSGTTAVSVILKGEWLIVNNVGDSRAFLCTEGEDGLEVKALSNDQTPYRQDERNRCTAAGATIMTSNQAEGLVPFHENWTLDLTKDVDTSGDPPRVWTKTGNGPGCAFTRSIGDRQAKQIGIIADPEQSIHRLNPADRFIVLATDGVFEFLSSQQVMEIVSQFDDPEDAAMRVVEVAFDRWLRNEVRTDDISIVVIFLNSFGGADDQPYCSPSITVRSSIESERFSFETERSMSSTAESDFYKKKKPSGRARSFANAARAISLVPLFRNMSPSHLQLAIQSMKLIDVEAGSKVMCRGDVDDRIFIVETGIYSARTAETKGTAAEDIIIRERGSYFGERGFLHGSCRALTVTAITSGQLWALSQSDYSAIFENFEADDEADKLTNDCMSSLLHEQKTAFIENFGYIATTRNMKTGNYFSSKVIAKRKASIANQLKFFSNEVSLLATLKSPPPVAPRLIGSVEDDFNLVSFYSDVVVCSADALVRRQLHVGESIRGWLCACLFASIQYFHGEGIRCGNISIQNVYLTEKGFFQLSDFRRSFRFSKSHRSSNQHMMADYWRLALLVIKLFVGEASANKLKGNSKDLKERAESQLQIYGRHLSSNALSFVRTLIKSSNPRELDVLQQHSYLVSIDWTDVESDISDDKSNDVTSSIRIGYASYPPRKC